MVKKGRYYMNMVMGAEDSGLFLTLYPWPGAYRVSIEDLWDAQQNGDDDFDDDDVLSAEVNQHFEYDEELKIAKFSGVHYSDECGFKICDEEEAHNVDSLEAALQVWGLNDNLICG